jgi:P27 family predicted phage terminase small subunit
MKSIFEHQIDGTYKESRHGNRAIMKQPKQIPPAPEHLTKEEGKIFSEIAKKLFENELLSSLDIYSLECYSVQLALYRRAKRELEKSGQYISSFTNKSGAVNLVPSPWLQVLKNSGDLLLKLSTKLALNPTDRHKATKTEKATNPTEKSYLV